MVQLSELRRAEAWDGVIVVAGGHVGFSRVLCTCTFARPECAKPCMLSPQFPRNLPKSEHSGSTADFAVIKACTFTP